MPTANPIANNSGERSLMIWKILALVLSMVFSFGIIYFSFSQGILFVIASCVSIASGIYVGLYPLSWFPNSRWTILSVGSASVTGVLGQVSILAIYYNYSIMPAIDVLGAHLLFSICFVMNFLGVQRTYRASSQRNSNS